MRILALALWVVLAQGANAQDRFLTLASTTSTQNSGLLDVILPQFTARTGIVVHVIAVGTGQALRIARNGDADAILVHHRPSEDDFVAQGYGVDRLDVMYNDFVIVGPSGDAAGIADSADAVDALSRIAATHSKFASRGDDSGTHKKEREIWAAAGIQPGGKWYLETGSGMGATLNLAQSLDTYVLVDRGTWITFGNKGNLKLLFAGDRALFNPYGYIAVDPARHPHVRFNLAERLGDWLVSAEGQSAIGSFRVLGQQAFCPNAANLSADIADRAACPAVVE